MSVSVAVEVGGWRSLGCVKSGWLTVAGCLSVGVVDVDGEGAWVCREVAG